MVLPGGPSFADQNAYPRMLRAIGVASLCGDPIPIEKIEVFQLLIFLSTSKTEFLSEPLFYCNEKMKFETGKMKLGCENLLFL